MARKKGTRLTQKQRKRSAPGSFTVGVRARYLGYYAGGLPSVSAAKKARTSLATISYHKRTDPEFAKQWEEAHDAFIDTLEQQAFMLAKSSDNRSPTMLIFMLKAWRPDRYRENVQVGGKVQHEHTFASSFAEAMARRVSGSPTPDRPGAEVH